MFCHTCGERMIGDGYSVVLHCPYADVYDVEPDANPVHCYDPVWKNDNMNRPLRVEKPSANSTTLWIKNTTWRSTPHIKHHLHGICVERSVTMYPAVMFTKELNVSVAGDWLRISSRNLEFHFRIFHFEIEILRFKFGFL